MRYVIMALVLLAFASSQAPADEVETGTGVVCNTAEQVEAFAAAYNGDSAETLQTANVTSNVCGILHVAYIKRETISYFIAKDGPAEIVKIDVVGIDIGMGFLWGDPLEQYTIFLVEGQDT